jgi:hypothetical protein
VAVKLIEVVLQVNSVVAGGTIAAVGPAKFCVITIKAVFEQPLAEVTVTV